MIGVDHPELGQELKAFIVRTPGAPLSPAEVRDWCALILARYKVPAEVEFVAALPYNAAGKLLKQELERSERGAAPEPSLPPVAVGCRAVTRGRRGALMPGWLV